MTIETSFSIGDKIYVLRDKRLRKQVMCGACRGKGKLTGMDELELKCPKCQDGFLTFHEKVQNHVVGPLTIGKVSVQVVESRGVEGYFGDNYAHQSKREESYMCEETGVGSGFVYYLHKGVFGSHEAAQAECDKRNKTKGQTND